MLAAMNGFGANRTADNRTLDHYSYLRSLSALGFSAKHETYLSLATRSAFAGARANLVFGHHADTVYVLAAGQDYGARNEYVALAL